MSNLLPVKSQQELPVIRVVSYGQIEWVLCARLEH
jgi:hypothetical protein